MKPIVSFFIVFFLFLVKGATFTAAQSIEETTVNRGEKDPYGSGIGLQILVTNSGFGLGGYLTRVVNGSLSFVLETSLGAGKDERELKFFRFGTSYIPNKAHYFMMLPVHVGFVHRLFKNDIEDNFRPFVQFTGGPTLGWEYPYFRDNNGNGVYESDLGERTYDPISGIVKGTFRPGIGVSVAIGAHFGFSRRVTQGVRIGYSFTYFIKGIQLLEPPVKAQQFFGTPTISLIFGKIQ